ncbi:MAG: winged helix-turn-helix transcriptional regulator [Candidatus Geothermarchaeales archaeon]
MRLDKTDLRILRILQDDGRATLSDVAEGAEVSVPTVRKRIEKMARLGVIERFKVRVNRSLFRGGVPVYLTLRTDKAESVAEELSKWSEIVEVSVTSGVNNLICKAYVDDMEGFRGLMERVGRLEAEVGSNIVLKSIKEERDFAVEPGMVLGLTCDTCGKEIEDHPIAYTRYNLEYYFCCQTCLKDFKKKMEYLA